MKRIEPKIYLLALFASIFLIAACSAEAQEAAPDTDSVASDEFVLSETYVFPGFGFSIDYPAGWSAETRDSFTVISEIESDLDSAFQEDSPSAEGFGLSLEQRPLSFMEGLGLPVGASLEDLFDFNKGFFEWQEPIELIETEAFKAPALSVISTTDDDWGYTLMGYTGDRAFLLQFSATSEQDLDDMMPTWEQMLASIQAVEE
jgi:hypothetical protein